MAKAGRKRKPGPRTKADRLSRAGVDPYDRGTERTQAMQALYGSDGVDAIGRAYRVGLLGDDAEAKAMLDTARRIHNAYQAIYAVGKYQCALADKQSGLIVDDDDGWGAIRKNRLDGDLEKVRRMGPRVKSAFDQLVIHVNADGGPDWLDRLCWTRINKRVGDDPADINRMAHVIDALAMLIWRA